ncbi:trypsin-like peptidase domain-containing protein [bacterium]|nr:trypsin-like peptidase domain-containing protein [bacterium]
MVSVKRIFMLIFLLIFLHTQNNILFSQSIISKDKVFLKNGRLINGNIVREEESFIKIKLENGSEIKISRESIKYIKKLEPAVIEKTEEFEKGQKTKGFVKYDGEWINKGDYEILSSRDSLRNEIIALREEKESILNEIAQLRGKRLYENKMFQFSFNPPENWKQMPVTDKESVCLFVNNQEDDFNEYIKISVAGRSADAIDQSFIDASISGLKENSEGHLNKIRGFDIVKVDGLNALKINMSSYFFKDANDNSENQEPLHQKRIIYTVLGETRMYKIEFSCLVKNFYEFYNLFEDCIKSFLIFDRPETEQIKYPDYKKTQVPAEQGGGTAEAQEDKPELSIAEQASQVSVPSEQFGSDKVYLKNGKLLEGTILQDLNEGVKLRVESLSTPEYVVTISRNEIDKIKWLSNEERLQKLQYEEEQRMKGLVKFYGHWIPIEKRDRFYRQADEEQDQIIMEKEQAGLNKQQEQERLKQQDAQNIQDGQMSALLLRIKELEEENSNLKEELEKQREINEKKLDEFLERERQKIPIGKVAAESIKSVLKIQVRSKYSYNDRYNYSASGAVISSKGIIISNYYIGNNPFREDWYVQLPDGEETKARIIEYDTILDIAVLKIDATGLKPIPVGNSDHLKQGDEIILVGAPLGYKDSYKAGRVLSLDSQLIDLIDVNVRLRWNIERKYGNLNIDRIAKLFKSDYGSVPMIQHDAVTYAKNNGGPLIDKMGSLVGINQNMNTRGKIEIIQPAMSQGFNMAVSINAVKRQRNFSRYLR